MRSHKLNLKSVYRKEAGKLINHVKKIGVLALQGSFSLHQEKLATLGADVIEIRNTSELDAVSALVIPGGESTTLLKLIDDDFRALLKEKIASGLPTLATCAGVILLAKNVSNPHQESLGVLDIDVKRNAYGRQVDSFIEPALNWTSDGKEFLINGQIQENEIEGVFIRAPSITRCGKNVKILISHENSPVLIKEGNILAATFHPELSKSVLSIHALLLTL